MKKTLSLFVLMFLLLGASSVMAQTTLRAVLSGAEEVPGVATNASGEAVFVVYPDRIEYTLTARNIGTAVSASHIHLGPRGVNGPVILFLFNSTTQGTFPGRVTGTLTAEDLIAMPDRGLSTFSDAVAAVLGGRTYANLHSVPLAPGGEIRGQIEVPK